jgi:hypothetical protein
MVIIGGVICLIVHIRLRFVRILYVLTKFLQSGLLLRVLRLKVFFLLNLPIKTKIAYTFIAC